MLRWSRSSIATAVAAILFAAEPVVADDDPSPRVTTFGAAHFAAMRPSSAFDMLTLAPGYTFIESDADVRGLSGASGNVLIDGARPASKQETLETLLRRIPASAVERIEILRPGAPGVDMQGHSVLANVVRKRSVATHGAAEIAADVHEHEVMTPRISAELAHDGGERQIELAAAIAEHVGDDHGGGAQRRVSPDPLLLERANVEQEELQRSLELDVAYTQRLASGRFGGSASYTRERAGEKSVEQQTLPAPAWEANDELERARAYELALSYERAFAGQLRLELQGLYDSSRNLERELSREVDEQSQFHSRTEMSERIVRGSLERAADRWSLEGGLELARNELDAASELFENGMAVVLPASRASVTEQRAEATVLASLRPTARWTLEGGARLEWSELARTSDNDVRKTFLFAKPRALLAFVPSADDQWRVLVERRVGQLDFEDFVSTSSLAVDTVTAGNPDLEPDRTWVMELAYERKFARSSDSASGVISIAVRRERISALVDHVPIVAAGETLDGIGNIGNGTRDELEIGLSTPLAALGLDTATLKISASWRSSRVRDPMTRRHRAISNDVPFEAVAHFTHSLPERNVHWGVDVEFAHVSTEFMVDEVRTERFGASVDAFVEYEPAPAWKVRVAANNLSDAKFERERKIHDGARGAGPLAYVETRTLELGPWASLSVRHTFGR